MCFLSATGIIPHMPAVSRYTKADALAVASKLGLPGDPDSLEQIRVGLEVEREHDDFSGGVLIVTGRIVAAHLREDAWYYLPLLALERFHEGKSQAPHVEIAIDRLPNGSCVVLGIEGVPEPLWASCFDSHAEALMVAKFLRERPALAIVYAWMNLVRPEG